MSPIANGFETSIELEVVIIVQLLNHALALLSQKPGYRQARSQQSPSHPRSRHSRPASIAIRPRREAISSTSSSPTRWIALSAARVILVMGERFAVRPGDRTAQHGFDLPLKEGRGSAAVIKVRHSVFSFFMDRDTARRGFHAASRDVTAIVGVSNLVASSPQSRGSISVCVGPKCSLLNTYQETSSCGLCFLPV